MMEKIEKKKRCKRKQDLPGSFIATQVIFFADHVYNKNWKVFQYWLHDFFFLIYPQNSNEYSKTHQLNFCQCPLLN